MIVGDYLGRLSIPNEKRGHNTLDFEFDLFCLAKKEITKCLLVSNLITFDLTSFSSCGQSNYVPRVYVHLRKCHCATSVSTLSTLSLTDSVLTKIEKIFISETLQFISLNDTTNC